jgi:hypothetical protein
MTLRRYRVKSREGATVAKQTTKSTKAGTASKKPSRPRAAAPAAKPAKTTKVAKVAKVAKAPKVQKVVRGAKKIAQNPATSEIVAATLVAAAAALRDPKRARALATEAGQEIKQAAKSGVDSGSALWQLAMDVARRSIDAIGGDSGGKGKKSGGKKAKKAGKKK